MDFESAKQPISNSEQERKDNYNKIRGFLKLISQELNKEGVPVNSDCRINMDSFIGSSPSFNSSDVLSDKAYLRNMELEFEKKRRADYQNTKPEEKAGELLEMLKTGIFHKIIGKDFAVMRSSRFDDIKNGVDNVVVDKENGNIVCAFDEVADRDRLERKKQEFSNAKNKEGASLKYAVIPQSGEKLQMKKIENIPTFYLGLSLEELNRGLKEFIPEMERTSDYEDRLYRYFISTIETQMHGLQLKSDINPIIKKRMEDFKLSLEKIKQAEN